MNDPSFMRDVKRISDNINWIAFFMLIMVIQNCAGCAK